MTGVEWDELVKPGIYALELILTSVVAFGTADKLLYSAADSGVRCALNNSIATCSAVIILGSLCFLGSAFTLWCRLLAAFTDEVFAKVDESGMCGLLAFGWLVIAILLSAKARLEFPSEISGAQFESIQSMRDVVVAFSWVNFVAFSASAALAAYKPEDSETGEAHLEYQSLRDDWGSGMAPQGAHGLGAAGRSADGLLGSGMPSGQRDELLESAGLRRVVEVRVPSGAGPSGAGPSSLGDVKYASPGDDMLSGDILSVANEAEWELPRRRKPPTVAFITPRTEAAKKADAAAKDDAAANADATADAEAETNAQMDAAQIKAFLS